MKLVILATTDGKTRELTVAPEVADSLIVALAAQAPAHPLTLEDGSVLHLNTRQVIGVAVEDAPGAPGVKMIPDPDPEHDPDRTVAQLKEALDKAGVEYPAGALKADLQELARENGV